MSELDTQFVKRGQWTNLEQGPVMGRTITTDASTGRLIIALLAILSSLGTAHLWHLLAFLFHQCRANGVPKDGLFRQQQAILRTLPTPSSLFADQIKLWWAWRRSADSAFTRSLPPAILAASCALSFLAASIFSSFVVTSSNIEVLVDSSFCGLIRHGHPLYIAGVSDLALIYAKECYGGDSTPSRCGNIFTQPHIPLKTQLTACPFSPNMCVNGTDNSTAVSIDSGLVDVGKAFGLNLAQKDNIKYRKKTTCTVMSLDGHTTVERVDVPAHLRAPGQVNPADYLQFRYGHRDRRVFGDLAETSMTLNLVNSNMSNTFTRKHEMYPMSEAKRDSALLAYWEPIPEIRRDDADIYLIGVGAGAMRYSWPVDDPLFAAHVVEKFIPESGQNETLYSSDFPMNVLGCAAQYQFCKIDNEGGWDCSRLSGLPWNSSFLFSDLSDLQGALFDLFIAKSEQFDLTIPTSLNVTSKVSGKTLQIFGLPADHWRYEVQYAESWLWAALQTSITDYAVGPAVRYPDIESRVKKPTTEAEKTLCGAQKMKKPGGFVNINLFGLVFIITMSCFLMIFDFALLKVMIFMTRFRKALAPRIDRWIHDGALQLQRRAYESQEQGNWTRRDQDVPITLERTELPDLVENCRPTIIPISIDVENGKGNDQVVVALRAKSQHSLRSEQEVCPIKDQQSVRTSITPDEILDSEISMEENSVRIGESLVRTAGGPNTA